VLLAEAWHNALLMFPVSMSHLKTAYDWSVVLGWNKALSRGATGDTKDFGPLQRMTTHECPERASVLCSFPVRCLIFPSIKECSNSSFTMSKDRSNQPFFASLLVLSIILPQDFQIVVMSSQPKILIILTSSEHGWYLVGFIS
jgi:hypothetical protein